MNQFGIQSALQASAHQRADGACGHKTVNISENERLLSLVGGSALLLMGLSRGKLGGLSTSVLGGACLYRGWSGHCYAYEAMGIDTADPQGATAIAARQGVKVEKSFVVQRPPEALYAVWRDLAQLPSIMRHLERVDVLDERWSRWVAKGPLGLRVSWEAEIFQEREHEMIAWRSLPGGQIETAGSVHFTRLPDNAGTEVRVSMKYNPPAGKLGAAIASLLGSDLEHEIEEDVLRFKSVMESGQTAPAEPR